MMLECKARRNPSPFFSIGTAGLHTLFLSKSNLLNSRHWRSSRLSFSSFQLPYFDLENTNQQLKSDLKDHYINSTIQVDCGEPKGYCNPYSLQTENLFTRFMSGFSESLRRSSARRERRSGSKRHVRLLKDRKTYANQHMLLLGEPNFLPQREHAPSIIFMDEIDSMALLVWNLEVAMVIVKCSGPCWSFSISWMVLKHLTRSKSCKQSCNEGLQVQGRLRWLLHLHEKSFKKSKWITMIGGRRKIASTQVTQLKQQVLRLLQLPHLPLLSPPGDTNQE